MPRKPVLSRREKMDADQLRHAWNQLAKGTERSQKELALLWGVNPSLISQYINGHIPLNTEAKLWFAKYLRRPAAEIWPDFEFTEAVTITLPPASDEAARLIAALSEKDQAVILNLLRAMPHRR